VLKKVCSTTTPNGETCFTEEDVALTPIGGGYSRSKEIAARHISFRWTPGNFDMDFHLAPRRRLVLVLEGGLEAETSDGEVRVFHPGDVWEIRDTWGKGHCSRAFEGRPFRTAFVALDDDITLDRRAPLSEQPDREQPCWVVQTETDATAGPRRSALPYTLGGIEGWVTDEYPATSFHYLVSENGKQFAYRTGARPSTECVLSGGFFESANEATRYRVSSGEIICKCDSREREYQRQAVVAPDERFLSIVVEADVTAGSPS
jgi:hypothetical protein